MSQGTVIYLYSGLAADYVTWSNAAKLYRFDTVALQWLVDIFPVPLSPYTALPSQWPNIAFSARAISTDGHHFLFVGGSEGDKSVNGAGSSQ